MDRTCSKDTVDGQLRRVQSFAHWIEIMITTKGLGFDPRSWLFFWLLSHIVSLKLTWPFTSNDSIH